jgi:uncharacterized protein YjiS (DUF1127 family)
MTWLMEGATSAMNLTTVIFRSRRSLVWSELKRHVAEWRSRGRSRHEMMGLSDRDLSDIGLTRTDAEHEGNKSFWMT